MERLQFHVERISKVGAYCGGALLFAAVGLVVFEVVARKFFEFSISGADELSGYAYALSMTWGFVYALHTHAHIRVDVLYVRLPHKVRCILDVVSLTAFTGLIGFLTYRAILVVEESIAIGALSSTPLAVPLVIPQVFWVAGLVFFTFCLVVVLVRVSRALVRGDFLRVEEIAKASHDE